MIKFELQKNKNAGEILISTSYYLGKLEEQYKGKEKKLRFLYRIYGRYYSKPK